MRFSFDGEQLQLRDALRELLESECTPQAVRATWDMPGGHSEKRWRALAEMGVVGCTTDEEHGGLGLDATWLVLLLEQAGWFALPEPLGVTTAVAVPLLQAAGAADLLRRIAGGETVVATCVPGRRYVEAADAADTLVLLDHNVVHAVPATAVTLTRQHAVDPGRRLFTVAWQPSGDSRVGDISAHERARAADGGLLSEAAETLGTASRLVELARRYALQREQFGVAIGSFQAVKHHLATALVEVEFARPLVYRAAWSLATRQPTSTADVVAAHAAMARAATIAARASLQVHGAIGYTWEHDLHVWLNRAVIPS